MHIKDLLITALLAASSQAYAADAVKLDVYEHGELKHSVSLAGANSTVQFPQTDIPNTTLELRLIAPEPLIVEVKETATDGAVAQAVGRIKLLKAGNSITVSDIKEAKFQSHYVLVRPD